MSGNLTTQEAIDDSQGARIIVSWSNSLKRLPGYREWVQAHYRKLKTWRDKHYLREMWIATAPR